MYLIHDRVVAVVIRRPVGKTAFTPPPANHMVNASGLWSLPSEPCAVGVRPNSAAPKDQRVLQQSA